MSDFTEADATHDVFFMTEGDNRIGPLMVVIGEESDDDSDMLQAAAVAQNAIERTEIEVHRRADDKIEKFDAGDARDWWA